MIAAAGDEAYAWPTAVALLSAALGSSIPVTCLFLADRIPGETRAELAEVFERHAVPCTIVAADLDPFDPFPAELHLTRTTYARLLVPATAEDLGPRTLYLDSDTLTIGDAAALASWPLDGNVVGACHGGDVGVWEQAGWAGMEDWRARGHAPDAAFFNAGVLVIDNERWRSEGVTAAALDLLEHHPELTMSSDQSALNTVLYGRWAAIPKRWNHIVHRSPSVRIGPLAVSRRAAVNLRRARILHYFEAVKPWHRLYPPGPLLTIYRSAWLRYARPPLPPARTLREWIRDRHGLGSQG